MCSEAADIPQGKCKDAAVCLISGNSAVSFGNKKEVQLDYRHQDEAVFLQYKGGDKCPPGMRFARNLPITSKITPLHA